MEFHCLWFHALYAMFWLSAKEVDGTFVGKFKGHTIILSQDTISTTIGYVVDGAEFTLD